MPGFDGIGANEYIVDVTYPDTVDFISAGDTPFVWELSIWYHTLNLGFRTRIAGETDFPCITDERVGSGRSYVSLQAPLSYAGWLNGLTMGRSYVSDGRAHLMDFRVGGVELGQKGSELSLSSPSTVHATVRVAAMLDQNPHRDLQVLQYDQKPYWSVERARIGDSREVPVELVVNGKVVARKQVIADGAVHDVVFDVPIAQSSWVAARILPAAHTNPIFVLVNNKPIRASRESARWCAMRCISAGHRKRPTSHPDNSPRRARLTSTPRKCISSWKRKVTSRNPQSAAGSSLPQCARLADFALGLFDQVIAAAHRQRHHSEGGMLIAGRGKALPPKTYRFGISCVWQNELRTPSFGETLIRAVPTS